MLGCRQPEQNLSLDVEYLSWTTLQSPTHLHHFSALVDAGQDATLSKSLAQSLLSHQEGFAGREFLSRLIAFRGIQK